MADELDPSMGIRIYGDASQLDKTLKETEKKVDESGKTMGDKVEKSMTSVADKLGRKIAKMVGAGFAIKALDDSLKILADGIKHGKGASEIALAIGDSILEGLRRVPIAGALGELLAIALDPFFGGPEEQKKAAEKYRELQFKERERRKGLEELEAISASPEKRAELDMRKKLREIDEKSEKALSTIQRITVFDETRYNAAVSKAYRQLLDKREKRVGPGKEMSHGEWSELMNEASRSVIRETFETQKFAEGDMARHQEIVEAQRLAKERVEAEYQREMEKLASKGGAKVGAPAALPDMDIPEVDVEEAVEDLHDTIAEHNSEAIISDTRMIGIATEQLTELKEMRRSLTAMAARQNGFNP